jgi:reactive intermediate/imine deaminase
MSQFSATIERIQTASAPPPGGHYAQAVASGELVFISGQLGGRPDGTPTHGLSFREQATQAISNLLAVAEKSGSGPGRILKVTAYIVGIENWPVFDRIYAEMFGENRPARSVVPVPMLHYGYLIEIEAVALRTVPTIP